MRKLYFAHRLSSVRGRLDGEDCIAVIDVIDSDRTLAKARVISIRELEQEATEASRGKTPVDLRAIEWLKRWSDKTVYRGKSVKQLLAYRGTSLWWFGETALYRDRILWRPALLEIIHRVDSIYLAFETHKPEAVHVEDGDTLTGMCAVGIANAMKIPVTVANPDKGQVNELVPIGVRKVRSLVSAFREVLAAVNRDRYSAGRAPDVLFVSYFHSLARDGDGWRDNNFYSLEEELGKPGNICRTLYVDRWYFSLGLKTLAINSIKALSAPRFPIELYGRTLGLGGASSTMKYRELWKRLASSQSFRDSLAYRDVCLWPMLRENLAFLFVKQVPEALECIATMGRALDAERPKVVLITNETGFYGRATVVAARARGIPTVGVAHGNVSDKEIEYLHDWDGKELPCPIPDLTTLYGEVDYKLLIRGGLYTDNNVVVAGSAQYDRLARAEEIFSRERVETKFGGRGKKLVAVTTQPFNVMKEREEWLEAVLTAAKTFDDAFFIIKPHPGEGVEMAEGMRARLGCANAVVTKDVDTKELLYVADAAITAYSMTGLEAMILGTPLLTVNLSGREEVWKYGEYGASMAVAKAAEIGPALRKALDGQLPPEIQKNAERFVRDNAFAIDGKSAERNLVAIKKLLEGRVKAASRKL